MDEEMKKQLSVVIITRNEEINLRKCLESIRQIADEIVVVDSNSSDQTQTIAREYGAKVQVTKDWLGFGVQKNLAVSLAKNDWILSIDADERVTPELSNEILDLLLGEPTHHAYEISRLSSYCGRFIKHSGWRPDYVLRLFNRQAARFSDDLVHERVLCSGKVHRLNNLLLHYSIRNFSQVLSKIDQYSSASAEQLYLRGQKSSLLKAVVHGFWAFVRTYFLRAGFLDGNHGFALAVSNAEGAYYRYLKLWLLILSEPVGLAPKTRDLLISVVVNTYNWPQALLLCLQGLSTQTDTNFEVIIADDGSTEETRELIQNYSVSSNMPIKHVWHSDEGFRRTLILNKAIAQSSGEYLVFLDGDCIVQPDFIATHRKLCQVGAMVTGSRVLIGKKLTKQLIDGGNWSYKKFIRSLLRFRLTGEINKILPLLFKLPDLHVRIYKKFVWKRIKGCNIAVWREDALKIQGFDEGMQGWGHEDADFVFRLHDGGVKRKSGAWCTEVMHLWHPTASKDNAAKNAEIVRAKILAKQNGYLK